MEMPECPREASISSIADARALLPEVAEGDEEEERQPWPFSQTRSQMLRCCYFSLGGNRDCLRHPDHLRGHLEDPGASTTSTSLSSMEALLKTAGMEAVEVLIRNWMMISLKQDRHEKPWSVQLTGDAGRIVFPQFPIVADVSRSLHRALQLGNRRLPLEAACQ
eukprot:Skav227767  [mRNA]  locus=scaffold1653:366005:375230:- [translate_table: standard]